MGWCLIKIYTEYAYKILQLFLDKTSFPTDVIPNEKYWRIYVTLYGKTESRGKCLACQASSDPDTSNAIIEAVKKCFGDSRFIYVEDYYLVLTIVGNPSAFNQDKFILGEHGISCDGAFFKETVAITSGYSLDQLVPALWRKAKAKEELSLWQHDCKSYMYGVGELSYAHKKVKTLDDLETRMDQAGEFIARQAIKDGLFVYLCNPVHKTISKENSMIRQLATLWVFYKWVNLRKRREYTNLCHFNLDIVRELYFKNFNEDKLNLAHLAFFLLATLQAQDNAETNELQNELVLRILTQQNRDGSFRTIVGEEGIDKGINYYPPEALYALNEYSKIKGIQIDGIEKGFQFYSEYYHSHPHTAPISWMSLAFGDRVSWMVDYLISQQHKEGYFKNIGTYSTCTFSEALAVHKRIPELKKALEFCFQLQFQKEDMYYLVNDSMLGGVRQSLTSCNLRIDFTQHFLHACMLAIRIL